MKKVMVMIIAAILVISCAIGMTACSQGTPASADNQQTGAVVQTNRLPATVKGTGYVTKAQTTAQTAAVSDDSACQKVAVDNDSSYVFEDPYAIYSNYRSNSPVYIAMYNTIQNSGANSYVICNIAGTDSEALVLSFGQTEADRYYDVYTIGSDDITYLGQIGGSHTVAYIDDMTGTLGLFNAHMGSYAYGLVWADDGLRVEYNDSGYAAAGESYPDVPGTPVSFYAATDFSGICMY